MCAYIYIYVYTHIYNTPVLGAMRAQLLGIPGPLAPALVQHDLERTHLFVIVSLLSLLLLLLLLL